jgi:chromosomal replication initiator protein
MAGAQALVRGERVGVSPLVLHGPSGVGKSRLLAGLAAEFVRRDPGAAVAVLDAEAFAAACAQAASRPRIAITPRDGDERTSIQSGWAELRGRFRSLDLLVLEDLDGLLRAPLALEELGHTLDALDARGAAVAVSTRSSPSQWTASESRSRSSSVSASASKPKSRTRTDPPWPARLVSRLLGGLAVRMDPPGVDARRRYLLEQARTLGLALAAESVESLAGASDGYRTLDGWLARLALESRLSLGNSPPPRSRPDSGSGFALGPSAASDRSPRAIGSAAVTSAIAEEAALAEGPATIEQIAKAVAGRFGVTVRDLRGPARRAVVAEPRHLAMHLARLYTDKSFAAVGAYFGGRDPATVRHACKAAAARLAAEPTLAAAVAVLCLPWRRPNGPTGS